MRRSAWLALVLPVSLAACGKAAAPALSDSATGPVFTDARLTRLDASADHARIGIGAEAAARWLAARKPEILRDAAALRIVKEEIDALGFEHIRLQQTVGGIPVMGGDVIVHVAGDEVYAVSGTLVAGLRVDTAAAIGADQAKEVLRGTLATLGIARVPEDLATPELRIVPTLAGDMLVWMSSTLIDGEQPMQLEAMIDAHSGAIVQLHDALEYAAGTGAGYFNGTVALETTPISGGFSLKDPSRGNQYTADMKNKQGGTPALFTDADNAWGNGTLADRATTGVDAQYGTAETWDYYLNVHGRNGIANDGKGAFNRVHYSRSYNNAYWSDSCFCMTYGDGDGVTYNPFDSLDVAGHEMTHGVTSRTAALTYSGESGGLNEATSDFFGTMVEFYAANANDAPDYLIGEKLYKSNPDGSKALRYMFDPAKDGRSAGCWYSGVGALDVHYSSGVGNHFYYLLAEGSAPAAGPASPTCGAGAVIGIGRAAAEKIYYRALTVYFTSTTDYHAARTASLKAATDLYPAAGSTEVAQTAAAWSAAGVN